MAIDEVVYIYIESICTLLYYCVLGRANRPICSGLLEEQLLSFASTRFVNCLPSGEGVLCLQQRRLMALGRLPAYIPPNLALTCAESLLNKWRGLLKRVMSEIAEPNYLS